MLQYLAKDIHATVGDPGVADFIQANWPLLLISAVAAFLIIRFWRALWGSVATRFVIILAFVLLALWWMLTVSGHLS